LFREVLGKEGENRKFCFLEFFLIWKIWLLKNFLSKRFEFNKKKKEDLGELAYVDLEFDVFFI
jgi:hypothetical protein